jgi:hypothetical protein
MAGALFISQALVSRILWWIMGSGVCSELKQGPNPRASGLCQIQPLGYRTWDGAMQNHGTPGFWYIIGKYFRGLINNSLFLARVLPNTACRCLLELEVNYFPIPWPTLGVGPPTHHSSFLLFKSFLATDQPRRSYILLGWLVVGTANRQNCFPPLLAGWYSQWEPLLGWLVQIHLLAKVNYGWILLDQ